MLFRDSNTEDQWSVITIINKYVLSLEIKTIHSIHNQLASVNCNLTKAVLARAKGLLTSSTHLSTLQEDPIKQHQDPAQTNARQGTQLLKGIQGAAWLTLTGVMRLVMLDKIKGLLLWDNIDVADPVLVCHTIYLVCNFHKLRPKCCGYKLSIRHISQTPYHIFFKRVKGFQLPSLAEDYTKGKCTLNHLGKTTIHNGGYWPH